MEMETGVQLSQQIGDSQYDETQLVSLKVPVTYLPYYQNSKEFEYVDGSIEIQGVRYRYVKRRIYNDSLEVMCIPDAAAVRLRQVNTAFFRFANGLCNGGQDRKQGAHSVLSHPLSPEYYPVRQSFLPHQPAFYKAKTRTVDDMSLLSRFRPVPYNPPEPPAFLHS